MRASSSASSSPASDVNAPAHSMRPNVLPGRQKSRERSSTPSNKGSASQSSTAATPDASSISCKCPTRPNPVTSVAACAPAASMASAPARLSSIMESMTGRMPASSRSPARNAAFAMPVPSALVQNSASPGRAPELRTMRSGRAVPNTARPYFGSLSSMEWPPARSAPASPTLSAPPRSTSATTSFPRLHGKARMLRAARGRAPIANTSESALAAATAPNS